MKLSDIRSRDQFQEFYADKHLASTEDKIEFLRKEMGIILMRGEELTPEEELSTLEQHALLGWDRISCLEKEVNEKIISSQQMYPDKEISSAFDRGLGDYAECGFEEKDIEEKKDMSEGEQPQTEIVADNDKKEEAAPFVLELERVSVLKGSMEEFRIRQSTMLRVAGFEKESVVDGPGIRYTIFVQGCLKHCPNCHNPETHDLNGGKLMSIYDIFKDIQEYKIVKGVTFSGGEPILQHQALTNLASVLREAGYNSIISYSGFIFEDIIRKNMLYPFLQQLDYLIDGPFVERLKSMDCKYRGSSNQRIIDVQASLKKKKTITTEL